ncbi:type II toxin-antitoxin system Phd/YefM family antitoxin [Aeromicrobium duanguangcaii]|uniref:type II toxin-antitoxin system Phd/YefM family antitoxin n=1 Tax=Aeromicrobium duanguangcaii TaxID=2968086 RepID=UPI002016C732|nr:type II toxin-antitoxin system Phd/YefM family antitoxin [Aeromicrobium duanguangcaii]
MSGKLVTIALSRLTYCLQVSNQWDLDTGQKLGYYRFMRTVPLSEAKDRLSALVDEADSTHEIIRITKHGREAAVLMSADDLESLHETIHALSTPGLVEDLKQAQRDFETGQTVTGEDVRARFAR